MFFILNLSDSIIVIGLRHLKKEIELSMFSWALAKLWLYMKVLQWWCDSIFFLFNALDSLMDTTLSLMKGKAHLLYATILVRRGE